MRQIDSVDAQTGPVLVVHQPRDAISAILRQVTAAAPLYDVTLPGGVNHTVWLVDDAAQIAQVDAAYGALELLYIAVRPPHRGLPPCGATRTQTTAAMRPITGS